MRFVAPALLLVWLPAAAPAQQPRSNGPGSTHIERILCFEDSAMPVRIGLLARLRELHLARAAAPALAVPLEELSRLAATLRADCERVLAPLGGSVQQVWWLLPGALIRVPADRAELLATLPGVRSVHANREHRAHVARATAARNHNADHLQQKLGWTGTGATLALLDSGLDLDMNGLGRAHRAFATIGSSPWQPSFRVRAAIGIVNPADVEDVNGHGTAVAAIAVGQDWGARGLFVSDHGFAPGADLVSYKITVGTGTATTTAILVTAWQRVLADRAQLDLRVANLSYSGSPRPSDPDQVAIDTAAFAGDLLIVTSAGNYDPALPVKPTANSQANTNGLAAGAILADSHQMFAQSSYGPLPGDGTRWFPDLVACGVGVGSALIDSESGGAYFTGTSFAAPMVAGTAAVLRAARPDLDALTTKAVLLNQVADVSAANPEQSRWNYGLGMLRSDLAANSLATMQAWQGTIDPLRKTISFPIQVRAGQRHAATLVWPRRDAASDNWSDLDLSVRNESGRLVALSASPRNLYERVLFESMYDGTWTLELGVTYLRPYPTPLPYALVFDRNHGGGRQAGSYQTYGTACNGSAPDPAAGTILPPAAAAGHGSKNTRVPFAYYSTRYQQAWPHGWLPPGLDVHRLALRRDEEQAASPSFDLHTEIELGYTARSAAQLDQEFGKNPVFGSMTRVLTTTRLVFPGTQDLPSSHRQFDFVIPLERPFKVQSSPARNLLIEVRIYSHSQGTRPFGLLFDAVDDPATSRVFSIGDPTAKYGSLPESVTAVLSLMPPQLPPIAPNLQGRGLPQLGETFGVVLRHARAGSPAVLLHGWSRSDWGGTPLPLDLSPFGAAGCWLLTDPALILAGATDAAGQWEQQYVVPRDPQLSGVMFHNQFFVLDPGVNPLGAAASNGASAIIGG